jgi:ubiquinone/menaquinone biosynthesis C-methylase UbiE
MFDIEQLNAIRRAEMERILPLIPIGSRVLEFGAGTGEQARFLAERGYDVVAIDLADSSYAADRLFPVTDYDGQHIPLPDDSVDVIFSSNVLEHVKNLPTIFSEYRRVLRPRGLSIHAVPTPIWRFWSFVSGVPTAIETTLRTLYESVAPPTGESRSQSLRRNIKKIVGAILPIGHGTSFEGISELWTFSSRSWRRRFEQNGFEVIEQRPMNLFYTGFLFLGPRLSIVTRERLSQTLGSSVQIFVTRPTSPDQK